MTLRTKSLVILLLLGVTSLAQTGETAGTDSVVPGPAASSSPPPEKKEFIFKPAIGLGTGMFSFFGDMYDKHFQPPMVSRIGYDLNVSQRMTDYLQFNFYALFGKLGANERLSANQSRNLNFESQIRVGGLNVTYNFGNFLKKDRSASPYISLGVESLEFLSKTDLLDAEGRRYFYWSDGSIHDMDESDPLAGSSAILHRDYTYETDIREMNADGFGKYPERTWAVPVGAGVIMKINDYWDVKLGTTMHSPLPTISMASVMKVSAIVQETAAMISFS
jgi:hypothetical protein